MFHDVKLNYHVPIISQQGEVAGRLQVEICRSSGTFADRMNETSSEGSSDSIHGSMPDVSDESVSTGNQITCRVTIKQATGLPPSLSNFVFCQYTFWGFPDPIVVPPVVNPEQSLENRAKDSLTFTFDSTKEFKINVNEEFVEHCTEGALSIEVWGNRSAGFGSSHSAWEVGDPKAVHSRSLSDRWSELKRKIELRVEILELNDQGDYSPVEVTLKPDVLTGGIYQLRQGQQRRIVVHVRPVQNSGTLPIICEAITSIAIGSVCARSKLQKGLDSYQEEDLTLLREKWSDCLMRRHDYLDDQIQKMFKKQDKTDQDHEREQRLIDQWVCLTEERNAVFVPASGSGIPGAPADSDPPLGIEKHIPVLFLDLNADDMSTSNSSGEGIPVAGVNSILPKEQNGQLFNLPIVKYCEKDICATAAWDSSIHDSIHLNRVTPTEERVYLILKATVRLSHPATMELVLRKRLCINVYKRQSLTEKLRRKVIRQETLSYSSVNYEVVSNIPKASEELEDRESLAQMAASGEDGNDFDGESYIEKYTRGVSAVESILTLDRLRQDVAIKELLAAQGRPLRKTASVPNISHILKMEGTPPKLDEQFHAESLSDFTSVNDSRQQRSRSLTNNKTNQPEARPSSNSFGLTSPQPTKFIKPMRTLLEEQYHREVTPLLTKSIGQQVKAADDAEDGLEMGAFKKQAEADESVVTDDEEFSEFESCQAKKVLSESQDTTTCQSVRETPLGQSMPVESFADLQSKTVGTPSMVSSGYGSQAVSSTTLSSDDSMSIRSISVDETPDSEAKVFKEMLSDKPLGQTSMDHVGNPLNGEIKPMACDPISNQTQLKNDADTDASSIATFSLVSVEVSTSDNTSSDLPSNEKKEYGLSNYSILNVEESSTQSAEFAIIPPPPSFSSAPSLSGYQAAKIREHASILRQHASQRASYPSGRNSTLEEQMITRPVGDNKLGSSTDDVSSPKYKSTEGLNSSLNSSETNISISSDINGDDNSFGSRADLSRAIDAPLPDWVVKGESVLIRPYNYSGTIAFIGPTDFASGIWVGVALDAPTGKNDGSVSGVEYFSCKPRHGIFVRADKLILDKRGRGMRSRHSTTASSTLAHSRSKTEGLSSSMIDVNSVTSLRHSRSKEVLTVIGRTDGLSGGMRRSKSRGDGLSDVSHNFQSFPTAASHYNKK